MPLRYVLVSLCLLAAISAAGDVLPYTVSTYGVEIQEDVVYRTAPGYWTEGPDHLSLTAQNWAQLLQTPRDLELMMDIYIPEDGGKAGRPLLLMMHGGAYVVGNKKEKGQAEWCRYFASLGYVAASIDYRLGFKTTQKGILGAEADALEDAGFALDFLLGREDLHIDPDRVFVAGTSAGGAVALGLAYASSGTSDCRILAVGNLWGYVRDLSVLENASVPILSFQSVEDPTVPYVDGYLLGMKIAGLVYGTKAVHDRAAALGIPCEHYPCSEKGHRLHLDKDGLTTPRFFEIRDRLTGFFARAMTGSL